MASTGGDWSSGIHFVPSLWWRTSADLRRPDCRQLSIRVTLNGRI